MGHALRILMLEASDADAERLAGALSDGGLKTRLARARDRGEFLRLLDGYRWDLVLCDSQHDDLTAREALTLLHERQRVIPLIVVGDGVDAGMAVSVMHAGAHDFVSKQDLSRLVPAIRRESHEQAEHRRTEHALQVTEQRFRQLSENIQEVFWLLDEAGEKTLYLSPSFESVWERPAQLMLSTPQYLLATIAPEDVPAIQQVVEERGWAALNHDYRIVLPDGAIRWIHTRSFPLGDEQGQGLRIAGVSSDITERKQLEQDKEMMLRALEQSADTVMITDTQGIIVYVNAAFEDISGYAKEEVIGQRPSLLRSGFQDEAFYRRVWQSLDVGVPFADVFINRRKDGELFYEAKTIAPLRGCDGSITHYVSTGKDITERLKGRERLHRLLHFDAVTGLANRVLLQDRLHQAVLHARRLHLHLGVICVGLGLSELLGEGQAPELQERMIRAAAERLLSVVEGLGQTTVARLDSDAFVVALNSIDDGEVLAQCSRAVIAAFERPLQAHGHELFLTPALGMSLCPEHAEEADTLLQRAEQAMQHARQHTVRAGVFYQPEMKLHRVSV